MDEKEKAILGANTLQFFCEQFGTDVYSLILLEELFKGLYYEEALFVLGEQEQGRDKTSDSPPE